MRLRLNRVKIVVNHMRPERVAAGETFIIEGGTVNAGFVVLLIGGKLLIECIKGGPTKPVAVTGIVSGSLIGDMGVRDTGPRFAPCTTSTDIAYVVLNRNRLETLHSVRSDYWPYRHVSARIAERYRQTQKKLVPFARFATTL